MESMDIVPKGQGPFLACPDDVGSNTNRLHHEHPFQNSLILEEIFKFLSSSVTEAKQIRSTCKLWNQCILSSWRETAVLKLGPPKTPVRTRGQQRSGPKNSVLPVDQFVWFILAPSDPLGMRQKPFKNYALYNINFSKLPDAFKVSMCPSARYSIRIDNLWNIMGAFQMEVESFKFQNCVFHRNKLEQFRGILEMKLCKVKRLILKNNILEPSISTSVVDYFEREGLRVLFQSGKPFHPTFVNLETLEIYGDIPLDLHILLVNSPVLKELKIKNQSISFTFSLLLRTILCTKRESDGKILILRNLQSLQVMDSSFFRHTMQSVEGGLKDINLPLTSISLNLEPFRAYSRVDFFDCKDMQDMRNIFMPVVSHYKDTLKVFKLFRPPVFQVSHFLMGERMKALEELYLWGNVTSSFHFLFDTPQLRVLYINTACEEKAEEFKHLYFASGDRRFVRLFWERYKPYSEDLMMSVYMGCRCPKTVICLESMERLHLECVVSCQMIRILAEWMPNLQCFKGILSDYEFTAVCKWFPKLSELGCLFNSSVDDATFLGRKRHRETPHNITSLRYLKRFEYQAYCNKSKIGNDLVSHGFLKMPCLQEVDIYVSDSLSQQTETLLRGHIPNVKIIRNYGNNSHGDGECCRRWAFHAKFAYDQW